MMVKNTVVLGPVSLPLYFLGYPDSEMTNLFHTRQADSPWPHGPRVLPSFPIGGSKGCPRTTGSRPSSREGVRCVGIPES